MKKLFSQLIGRPVICQEAGGPVARVFDLIFDPDTGVLVAVSVHPRMREVVVARDIRAWSPSIIIRDHDSITPPEDVVKVQQVLRRRVPLFRNRVVTRSGKDIGRVVDYLIDLDTDTLLKIMVAKLFLGIIVYSDRVFSARDIVEMRPDRIIVRDDTETATVEVGEQSLNPEPT